MRKAQVNTALGFMRRAVRLFCISILLAFFGCSEDQLAWTEEVSLPDGRIITLQRWTEFRGGSGWPGSVSGESRQRIKFRHPNTDQTITWENDINEGLQGVVALWIDEAGPNLLVTPMYSGDFRRYGCPNPSYMLFKHVGGIWIRRPLTDIRGMRIRSNVTERAREAEPMIRASGHHLSAVQTLDSHVYVDVKKVAFLIDFGRPYLETIGDENCNKPRNLLIGHNDGQS